MTSLLCPVTLRACATCEGLQCELKLAAQAEEPDEPDEPDEVSGTFRGLLLALVLEGLVGILLLFLILVAVQ